MPRGSGRQRGRCADGEVEVLERLPAGAAHRDGADTEPLAGLAQGQPINDGEANGRGLSRFQQGEKLLNQGGIRRWGLT